MNGTSYTHSPRSDAIMESAALEQPQAKPRLVLIDGSGYIFRAYHAIRPMSRPDGTPIHAVFGFTNMLLKLRETYAHDYLTVIFDASRKSFRNEFYADYKAHRPPAPDDLVPQFPLTREAVRAIGVPCIELDQFEADDLIASYASAGLEKGIEVVVVSSDKDLMQLIRPGITMYDPMKDKPIAEAEVLEKFGVTPDKVIEVQALIGDPTDNVPGVPSVGPKTAAELINEFGNLEAVLANLDRIKQPKRREVLAQHADNARISRRLVELKTDVPLPESVESFEVAPLDKDKLIAFLTAQNFTSILKRLGAASVSAPFSHNDRAQPAQTQTLAAPSAINRDSYGIVRDLPTLQRWIARAIAEGRVAIDTETTSLDAMRAELVGISLAITPGEACYIPLAHVDKAAVAAPSQSSLFDAAASEAVRAPDQLNVNEALAALAPLFIHPGVLKIGHNLKYDLLVLHKYRANITPIADTMLLSYCTSAGLHAHGLDELAMLHLGHTNISFKDMVGSGKAQISFAEVPIEKAALYAAEDADVTLRLYERLAPELIAQRTVSIYEECERALVPVLVDMEARGITISKPTLAGMSQEFSALARTLELEIHKLAGREFSVGSPKQLGEVLFEHMGLAGGKKSAKSGAYTTDAETLEALSAEGHDIADKVLEWRHLSKLQSTYTDSLPLQVNPTTDRVHTSYSMATATTGRLSSTDPNLQNIPIRTEAGKRIRTAFVAAPGHKLISADYSQIELRLLAHLAGIDSLKQAFTEGRDIHAITASQIFGVPLEQVDSDLRRKAKTINFGIIYGMSAHGLATRLGIGRGEAAGYIDAYFKQYPGIREYMTTTIEFAREHGYVLTLFGRRVYVKDIAAKNPNLRAFSERAAINAPLQGTAADVIKRAMVDVKRQLAARYPHSHMLLQVHDELIIEAPEAEAQEVATLVRKVMQAAASFSVPLTVEAGVGDNWGEIH